MGTLTSHVTDGKTSKRRIVSEGLNTHGLRWHHLDDGRITRLDELGGVLNGFTRAAINLLQELRELAGNVGGVAIQDRSVASTDLTRMVEDNDLGVEGVGTLGRVILGVTSNVSTANLLDGDVLDVETNVVTGKTLNKLFVVHLNGLDFSGDVGRGKGHDHTGLDDTGLNTSDGHRANTANLVHILKRKTESLVSRAAGRVNGIDGLEQSLAGRLGLGLLLPALVPWAVAGVINHVVAIKTRDGDEGDSLGVVSDFLDEGRCLLDNFVETILGPFGGVHLVDSDNELLDTEGVGKQSVFTGLTILGDTSLELTGTRGNDENSAVSLGGTSNHVLDEITVTGGI